jgi:hypothetical protein
MDERERDGDTPRLESVTPHENDRFDGRKTRCDVNCDPPDRLDEFGHLLSGTSWAAGVYVVYLRVTVILTNIRCY